MLPPATSDAQVIKSLYDGVFIFAIITFVLVEGLLLISAFKFQRRRADDAPVQVHGNNAAELTWTIIPAIVVAIVFGMSIDAVGKLTGHGSSAAPVARVHALTDAASALRVADTEKVDLVIEVTGRQWFWQYAYKGDAQITGDSNDGPDGKPKPLVIPAGKRVRLDLTAADVIHAWWVPQFGSMIYVNPGERSYIFIKDVAPGLYIGQCNVFCGARHAYMLSPVLVLPEAEYDAWLKAQAAEQGAATGPVVAGDPAKGKLLFLGEGTDGQICWTCHVIEGTKAVGKTAPREMTKFAEYPTIAQIDGFANTPENLKKWLTDPQGVKPGTAMPNLQLKPQQVEDLIAYLTSLK
jgi:cytochrome c oxidase subunit II